MKFSVRVASSLVLGFGGGMVDFVLKRCWSRNVWKDEKGMTVVRGDELYEAFELVILISHGSRVSVGYSGVIVKVSQQDFVYSV